MQKRPTTRDVGSEKSFLPMGFERICARARTWHGVATTPIREYPFSTASLNAARVGADVYLDEA